MPSAYYNKYGYDVEVLIDNLLITATDNKSADNGLSDTMTISIVENQARQVNFSIIPPRDVVEFTAFEGKRVQINLRNANGWKQVFDGYIDVPTLDIWTRKLNFQCSDRRREKVLALQTGIVDGIGSYSEAVFGTAKDKADELDKRLETVAASFDFNGEGQYFLTPWLAKSTPDFTITNSQAFRTSPRVTITDRSSATNKITLTLNYTYQRLHQQTAFFEFSGWPTFADWWADNRPTFPGRDTIRSAATQGNWKLVGNINYSAVFPQGMYDVGTDQVFNTPDGTIIWNPNLTQNELRERKEFKGYLKDGSGNFVTVGSPPQTVPQYETVKDADGNPIYDVVRTTTFDTSSHLCTAANWTSGIKFSQTVTEKYTIVMQAPQAINQYGVKEEGITYNVDDPYDNQEWENSNTINNTQDPFYVDVKNKVLDKNKMIQVALNRARHLILKNYRGLTVQFRTVKLSPEYDLQHTIRLDVDEFNRNWTSEIDAIGKVKTVVHTINFKTTEAYTYVELALSRSSGSATTSQWAVPDVIQNPGYIGNRINIKLGLYTGDDPADFGTNAEKWTGWIANAWYISANGWRKTEFQEKFVVDFPELPQSLRDQLTYNSNVTFDLEIPSDSLFTST